MKLIVIFRNFADAPDCEREWMWDTYYSQERWSAYKILVGKTSRQIW